MILLRKIFSNFLKEEKGVTALEYGLIAGLIFLAIVTALSNLSEETAGLYNTVEEEMSNAIK